LEVTNSLFYLYTIKQTQYKMTIEAKYLKVGDRYKSGKTIQEVTSIVGISEKTIEFRTLRVYPDIYGGDLFQRKSLTTKVQIAK